MMTKDRVIGRLECIIDGYKTRDDEYVINDGIIETLKEAVRHLKESDKMIGKWIPSDYPLDEITNGDTDE